MEEMAKLLEMANKVMLEQEKLFQKEIVNLKDDKKRNNVLSLYNEMKSSEKPLDYIDKIRKELEIK